MESIVIRNGEKSFNLTLPTSVDEIKPEYLLGVVEDVDIAPDYALVAVIYESKLYNILNVNRKKSEDTVNAKVLFVRSDGGDSEFIKKAKVKDAVITTGSELAMSIHVKTAKNVLSIPSVINLCTTDKDIYRKAIGLLNTHLFVEFKLMPHSSIKAIANADKTFDTDITKTWLNEKKD